MSDKLVAKVNNVDASDFVWKTKTDRTELENKIPVCNLVKETKLTESENKIRDVSNLATKIALTTIEIKYPMLVVLLKKQDYNTKITDIENKLKNHNHDKYIDTLEFNKLVTDVFHARLAQGNLITKTDFDAKLLSQKIYSK